MGYGFWETNIVLPSWKGFQSRLGPYGAKDSNKKSTGKTRLAISSTGEDKTPPTHDQIAAYHYLLEHQDIIRDKILFAVFNKYPSFRARFFEFTRTPEETLPIIKEADELKNMIGLATVLIHSVSWEEVAYVGYEFGCVWDAEHGLGAMTHCDRIIEVELADTAILEWIAERDIKRLRAKKRKK